MHPIENIIKITMSELKEMIDVNTIVGTPFVSPGGCTIIPISRLSFGFISGGGEYGRHDRTREEGQYPFTGGAASGVSISPVAFMVADEKNIKLLTVSHRNALDKVVENIPQVISEIKDILQGDCCCEGEDYGCEDEDCGCGDECGEECECGCQDDAEE